MPPLLMCALPGCAQDPLGLGKTESSLERFTEAELMNGRWAMLGVAGAVVPEVLGLGDWWSAPLWVSLLCLAADTDTLVRRQEYTCDAAAMTRHLQLRVQTPQPHCRQPRCALLAALAWQLILNTNVINHATTVLLPTCTGSQRRIPVLPRRPAAVLAGDAAGCGASGHGGR
jgi:Chlorophyll A-B binding protein